MTVYITQETTGRNFHSARRYGDLVSLLPSQAQVTLSSLPTIRKLRRGLKDFTKDDYLLLSGDPIIMGLAIVIALEVSNGRGHILKWDKIDREYYPVTLDLYEKGEFNEE